MILQDLPAGTVFTLADCEPYLRGVEYTVRSQEEGCTICSNAYTSWIYMPKNQAVHVSTSHRGYTIKPLPNGGFEVLHPSGHRVTTCGARWDCICYIDELLSP